MIVTGSLISEMLKHENNESRSSLNRVLCCIHYEEIRTKGPRTKGSQILRAVPAQQVGHDLTLSTVALGSEDGSGAKMAGTG